jgi:hypothetical protein
MLGFPQTFSKHSGGSPNILFFQRVPHRIEKTLRNNKQQTQKQEKKMLLDTPVSNSRNYFKLLFGINFND